MTNVLITGGAGFIGVNLAARYLEKGENVTVLDNFSRKGSKSNAEWLKNKFSNVKILQGDIRKKEDIDKALADNTDLCFHLAGQVAVTTSVTNPMVDFDINCFGTINVLEAIRRCKNDPAFVYSSTNKVYGGMESVNVVEDENRYEYQDLPNGISESFPLDFHSPYGCSKGAADQYTRDYARIYGLKTVVFRQSCIYGYHQFGIEDQGWLAWFVIQSVLNRPITIFGDGKQARDVLFIEDLNDAYEKACENIEKIKGQIYNIGGGPKYRISLLEALDIIRKNSETELKISFKDARPGDQKIYVSDISKAKKDFGWEPKTEIGEGIKKLSDWVRENKALFQ
tara:strand:+ start:2768 stop:3787 length:1020 start_codon:yes stop_codon:yes gene_type:complete